jgi:hypothetical protein
MQVAIDFIPAKTGELKAETLYVTNPKEAEVYILSKYGPCRYLAVIPIPEKV